MSPQIISTKFGNATLTPNGYYRISSKKEGNNNKYLHSLIFEDYYGVTLLPQTVVHHIDGDKTNNEINNLKPMTLFEHSLFHNNDKSKLDQSKVRNTTGYFRVIKVKNPAYKQGFTWKYRYYEDGKRKYLSCTDLNGLKEKVLSKGLRWEHVHVEA